LLPVLGLGTLDILQLASQNHLPWQPSFSPRLSGEDECFWYQSYSGSRNSCLNGTLLVLSLEGNHLKGLLPKDIALLNSLTLLNLHSSSNSLTGSIPSEIGALTTLTELILSDNSLTGSIPSEIGVLTTLTVLYLSYNSFIGSIPSEIGSVCV
jgi:Leucine-rich repeat (LRR) protein